MSTPLLSLSGVSKRYGATAVLQDVDLEVHPGEIVILIGGSGSGKTTLLRLVAGLEAADGGVIRLRGATVDAPGRGDWVAPERRGLGMVFQDHALWPHMSSLENVAAAATGPGRDRRHAALGLLEQVGLHALADRRPHQLSGGQQQRVGLARALAAGSDLVLFDEPLSSLDVDVRERMRAEIRARVRERGAAALLVSHDPLDAWRLADRVAVLERGRIVQTDTPQVLYARPATERVARFTDAIGGFPVEVLGRGAEAGFDLAGVRQGATAVGVRPGQRGRAYVRPCGVQTCTEGAPASLVDRTFEAGLWRAVWRVPPCGWTLQSLEREPPPKEARLSLRPEHSFIYPALEDTP